MGFLDFFFGEPKILSEERQKCLDYLKEEFELTAFQDKEAALYNNVAVKYLDSISVDSSAAEAMCQAANRLSQAASEIMKRRSKITSIPHTASAVFFGWQATFQEYLAWTQALVAAVEASANGMTPQMEYVEAIRSQSEKFRRKAEAELKKLLERLKLSGDEMRELFVNASRNVTAEDWQPKDVPKKTPRKRSTT